MRLAYVGADHVLRVCDLSDPDADHAQLSVPGLRCTWPTCSPDGETVAFSGTAGGSNGYALIGLYTARTVGESPGRVYANSPGTDGIAGGTPHYCCWSPDGSKLAFIAQTHNGLTLYVWDSTYESPPRGLHDGGPLYLAWSPDSSELFVHSFTSHYLMSASSEEGASQFPGVSTQYMAPSWARDGSRIAFFLDGESGRQRLVAIDLQDRAVKVLTELSGIAAAAWRPGHFQVGLIKSMIGSSGFYSGLSVIDYETSEEARITEDPVLAFFWSPDGSRVAFVTPSEGAEGSLRLAVAGVGSGDTSYLADFRPSQEQLTHFMFFDQYAQSHPVWSPDGASLLVFGELGYHVQRTPLDGGQSNRAIVLDATGMREPQVVAQAHIGCWGP